MLPGRKCHSHQRQIGCPNDRPGTAEQQYLLENLRGELYGARKQEEEGVLVPGIHRRRAKSEDIDHDRKSFLGFDHFLVIFPKEMNFLPGADLNLHPHALPEGDPNGVSFRHETIEGYVVPKQGWDVGSWDGVLLPFHPGKLNGGTNREQGQASSRSRRKGTCLLNDRLRRQRISERIVALQLLVPNSKQGGQSSALDEITTYIQHLQLQLENLSTSTLGAEAAPGNHPLIFPQSLGLGTYTHGYGPEAKNNGIRGPVGELMGKLMEERPMLAKQLLESKGLFLVPTTLAPELGSVGSSSNSNNIL
ncbi:hypothetical protein MLD38_040535 [Melastoma candidum]|nr:hypothetical protein MLD38_040535 [Melastoma candidum]